MSRDRNIPACQKSGLSCLGLLELRFLLRRKQLAFFTQLLSLSFFFLLTTKPLSFLAFFFFTLLAFFLFNEPTTFFLFGTRLFFSLFCAAIRACRAAIAAFGAFLGGAAAGSGAAFFFFFFFFLSAAELGASAPSSSSSSSLPAAASASPPLSSPEIFASACVDAEPSVGSLAFGCVAEPGALVPFSDGASCVSFCCDAFFCAACAFFFSFSRSFFKCSFSFLVKRRGGSGSDCMAAPPPAPPASAPADAGVASCSCLSGAPEPSDSFDASLFSGSSVCRLF